MFKQFRASLARGVPHQEGAAILEVSGLHARYNGVAALEDVTFCLDTGERVAVVGPNGAGKSTLFKIIAGVKQPAAGRVSVYGHGPGGHICIAYVPQRSQVDWSFPITVSDVVMMGRTGKIGLLRWPRKSDREKVHASLELVEMAALGNRQISELSGGQQQRVFIAQALAQEADLILMDEPLAGLDAPSREAIFRILDALRASGVTVMIATHDLNLAGDRFDRVLLLNRRLLAFGPPREVLTPEHLLTAYGGHMHVIETGDGPLLMIEDACHDRDRPRKTGH